MQNRSPANAQQTSASSFVSNVISSSSSAIQRALQNHYQHMSQQRSPIQAQSFFPDYAHVLRERLSATTTQPAVQAAAVVTGSAAAVSRMPSLVTQQQSVQPFIPKSSPSAVSNLLKYFGWNAVSLTAENGIFYPIAKRIAQKQIPSVNAQKQISLVNGGYNIFKDIALKGVFNSLKSLYSGARIALIESTLSRGYRVTVQPAFENTLRSRLDTTLRRNLTETYTGPMIKGLAASWTGVFEAYLLSPLDGLKTRYFAGVQQKTLWDTVKTTQVRELTRGSSLVAARNGIGSFVWFGIPAIMNTLMGGNKASVGLQLAGSMAGSAAAVISTNPFTVIKFHKQLNPSVSSSFGLFKKVVAEQGVKALWKGCGGSLAANVFKMTFAQFFMSKAQELTQQPAPAATPRRVR